MVEHKRALAALTLSGILGGCVGSGGPDLEAERERLAPFILDSAPKNIPHKLDIDYDGKAVLLGYALDPDSRHRPGREVKLTMYWQLKSDLPEGWNLFTHVLDGAGVRLLNIDNVGPLRKWLGSSQLLPPADWQVGKVYVDEQKFIIPAVKSDRIEIMAGIWKGEERLKVVKGPHDSENRGRVATLELTSETKKPKRRKARKEPRVPRLRVDKLDPELKIKIDGVLDEPAWRRAAGTRYFVDVTTGKKNTKFPINGRVKLLYDDDALYLGFDIKDPDLRGGFDKKEKDPHLWTRDAVEIMIDPDGDGDNKDYYEIQVNPQNLVFDSRFDDYNLPKGSGSDGPFGHEDWSSKLTSAVTVSGTLDKPGDEDQGYVVEIKLPWNALDKARKAPPDSGDTWRMNFYAIQDNSGVAWSPILKKGNFHKASRFGQVTFIDRKAPPELKGALGDRAPGAGRNHGRLRALDPAMRKAPLGSARPVPRLPQRPATPPSQNPPVEEP